MFFFAPSELMPEFIVGTFSKFSSASNFLGTFGNLTFLVKSGSTKPEPVSGKKNLGSLFFFVLDGSRTAFLFLMNSRQLVS